MLQRKEDGSPDLPLREHGFMLSVELEDGGKTTVNDCVKKLSDSLAFAEGTGTVDVEYIGDITEVETEGTPV